MADSLAHLAAQGDVEDARSRPGMPRARISFGIMTAPQQVSYGDVLRVWTGADANPVIEHAWLFDHLLPIGGDPQGPILEGWTLLAALAARTQRLRLGLLVTANRLRPPAHLAKIAATVDVVSGGRLDFGIGVGSRPHPPQARREYAAYGIPFDEDTTRAIDAFAEACTLVRRLWTEPEPFDATGPHYPLTGAHCNPKPIQHPHPPIVIGGRSTATLRVVAEHADIWNMPGGTPQEWSDRNALLDRLCVQIDRDPGRITRSLFVPISYDHPATTSATIDQAIDAGFTHLVLGLGAPYPPDVIAWVSDVVIGARHTAAR